MDQPADTNAAIWQSEEIVRTWTAETENASGTVRRSGG
jgi:hypothetical protein